MGVLSKFREKNKYILGFGISVLMIIFLIQPSLSMFGPNPAKQPVGHTLDKNFTMGDERQADNEMRLIRMALGGLADLELGLIDARQWMLMRYEASQMGLSASRQELPDLPVESKKLDDLALQNSVTREMIDRALLGWLTIQRYKTLVSGVASISANERMMRQFSVYQALQQGAQMTAIMAMQSTMGNPRVSEPLLGTLMSDLSATADVTILPIKAIRYLDQISTPSEAQLSDIFEQYKDDLPGTGEPAGFGYKYPDRVKIEYMVIPDDELKLTVEIEEADLLSYYDAHRDSYTQPTSTGDATPPTHDTPPTTPAATTPTGTTAGPAIPQSYEQVRAQIVDQLQREKASLLGTQIARYVRGMLLEQARSLPTNQGYRSVPDDGSWVAMPLDEVARKVQEKFGVLPEVYRRDDRWLDRDSLSALPMIGLSVLVLDGKSTADNLTTRMRSPRFGDYVFSAVEIDTDAKRMLASTRLQVGLPSLTLIGQFDDSRYIFRLVEAQATHEPTTLDEVRHQVMIDARELSAYQLLVAAEPEWQIRAQTEGLEQLAETIKRAVSEPKAFPRRVAYPGMPATAPNFSPIGQDESYVDAVFDRIAELYGNHQADDGGLIQLSDLPIAHRTLAMTIDRNRALYLTRIDGYEPISRDAVKLQAGSGVRLTYLNQMLMADAIRDRVDAGENVSKFNPLSYEAIAARIGFVAADDGDGGDDDNASDEGQSDSSGESGVISEADASDTNSI